MEEYNVPLRGYYTCKIEVVIYLLKCPCSKSYVGQTNRMIKTRLNEHKSNLRLYHTRRNEASQELKVKYGETGVAKHFNEMGHQVNDLRWQIIVQIYEKNKHECHIKLLKREAYSINKLEILSPKGLNENCQLCIFL